MLNVVNESLEAAFYVGGDPLLHLLRLQAGVGPDQRNDRDIDLGENVHWSAQQHDWKQKDNGKRHHHERVWPAKR